MKETRRNLAYLCSICGRSLPVGAWYQGHWVCFWCSRHVSDEAKTGNVEKSCLHGHAMRKRAIVEIEEIGQEL